MRLPSRANNKRETVDVPRKKKRLWCQIVEEFCSHTTIHGLNHVAEKLFTPFERTVWCWLFLLAVVGASFCGNQVWDYYKTGSTATFVESTRYQYSNVPFPAVILCDKSRVHWPKALALTKHDLPEPFNVTKQKALVLLKRLGYVTFGDFDFLNQIRFSNMTFEEIAELNITELMLKVMRPCNEMFSELCIWRSLEYNCCRLFELQKSELGFCYSFNSDTSEISKSLSYGWAADGKEYWVDAWGDKRPRRTAQLGSWGGLRFTVNVLPQSEMPPDGNNTTPGIALMVTDPKAFPMDSYVEIGSGQFGLVSVVGDALATEARVRSVLPQHRKCLFYQETDSTSPTGYYLEANCKTLCFQKYSIKYCNCSPEFMFFNNDDKGNKFPDCNVEGLLCLSRVNEILTFEIPSRSQHFFDSPGMKCSCPIDCNSQQYISELTITQNMNQSDTITVDVNFKMSSCVLYKTDIRYDWLDVLVAFGGIAGLFTGASLLSGVEVIYFLTVRFYYAKRKRNEKSGETITKTKTRLAKKKPMRIKVLPWVY